MSKELLPCIIPIGVADWKRKLEVLAYSVTIKTDENPYRKMRFYEDLHWNAGLPKFYPHQMIELADGVIFRVTISLNLYPYSIDKMVTIPWEEELVPYDEASWYTAERLIKESSNFVLILKSNAYYADEISNQVIGICDKYDRSYKIINDSDRAFYSDLKQWFLNHEKEV